MIEFNMKSNPIKQKAKTTNDLRNSTNFPNRNFGVDVDRKLGRYLQRRGLPALAEILKIDK